MEADLEEFRMSRYGIASALMASLLVAGCSTAPETRVTRFHLNQPIARGQIQVEPARPGDRGSLEFQTYANIVGRELARLGFNEAPGLTTSEQVAAIAVERGTRESLRRSGLTIGLGGGNYGWNGGVGGGVSFPVGGNRSKEVVGTRLIVQIKRRSDATTIWEGRAETEAPAGSPAAQPGEAVAKLAAALFQDFPGVSGRTITVK